MNDGEHLDSILRHIGRVQENCLLLARRLQDNNEHDFARQLIANSMIHDNSKFSGVEFLFLRDGVDPEKFKLALDQHQIANPHHPEYWDGGIKEMPRIYLCELVADITARSQEFGSDLRDWFKDKAMKKYKITSSCRVYKEIKDFIDLLLEKKFS